MTTSTQYLQGPFIDENLYLPEDPHQLIVKLTDNNRDVANAVNVREIGSYVQDEIVTGSVLYSSTSNQTTVPVYRKVIRFGALPNTATKTVAHGINITNQFIFLKAWATANDPTGLTFISFGFSDPTTAQALSLSVTATNVSILANSNYSNFTSCNVVLEYIKSP